MRLASDRRQCSRFRSALAVTDGRRDVRTITRDISASGLFVCDLSYSMGDRVSVAIHFPDSSVPMQVAGDVVRVERGLGVALRLIHAGEAQQTYFSGRVVRLAWAKTEPA